MEKNDFLEALEREGAAFAESCERAGGSTRVPSCPEWSVNDLVWHTAEVHHFWRTVVRERLADPAGYVDVERPADGDLVPFFRIGLDDTVAVLSAADPAQPNWTWATDHSAGFVQRRMAQETAVHRYDADLAAGRPTPIDAALAGDGIDEFLHWHLGPSRNDAPKANGSVHLHCTDVAGEWTVREVDGVHSVTREHAKGDCALRGAASDLLLVLWRRLPLSAADVVGDADVAARFVAYTSLD